MHSELIQIDHKNYPEQLKTKSFAELHFIIRDAHEAVSINPNGEKAGYYLDEINYASMELKARQQ